MIEKVKKQKEFVIFGGACLLFVAAILFLISVQITMERQLNEEPEDPIEVALPVVDWQKYSDLSKRYPNDIIDYR